jgi:thiamine biosynthesis lipoprotein
MSSEKAPDSSRRDFLTGRAARSQLEQTGEQLADALLESDAAPGPLTSGDTIRLSARAMACEFCVIMNPGPATQIMHASAALDMLDSLEDQMSVYRSHGELSQLNRRAGTEPVTVDPRLFALLAEARRLWSDTEGAFDITSGPLIALWSDCRKQGRVPTTKEVDDCRRRCGMQHVSFDDERGQVRFQCSGLELNLGGIGKGEALDRAGRILQDHGMENWLFHGGRSSILARGDHNGQGGWPVGIKNPLFTRERYGTLLLRDRAMSSSGSNIQYYRSGGRRYGHILDPRTGWPADELLSATALAPTAAEADALSTAFFVLGVEKTKAYCDNRKQASAILFPRPRRGRALEPILFGLPEGALSTPAGTA